MARKYRGDGKNPYIKGNSDAKYNYDLVMDEARQKWRAGNWRAAPEAFKLQRGSFELDDEHKGERPSSERFELDVKTDLLGDSISMAALENLKYSPSYRPKGKLSERIAEPMSTPRRYDVLAGLKETPPEDLGFLSDASVRRKRVGVHDGALRVDTRRLDVPVDERRSAILRMMPKAPVDDTGKIIDDAKRRKAREDRELGKPREEKEFKKRFLDTDPANEAAFKAYMEHGADRLSRLPEQNGMAANTQELPEFERQSRHWSELTKLNPTAADVLRISENYVPDEEEPDDSNAHYISDVEFNPDRPFRRAKGTLPRAKKIGTIDGKYKSVYNDYVREAGVDPDRIQEIMNHRYRGRWIPPEFFNDDELVAEYFHQSNRGNVLGEDFVTWAQRQRRQVEQLEYEEYMRENAKRERHRAPTPGRHAGMPPRVGIGSSVHAPSLDEYDEIMSLGMEEGKDLRQKEIEREKALEKERRKKRELEAKRAAGIYAGQYPELFAKNGSRKAAEEQKPPETDKTFSQYRKQYEQYQKQMAQYQKQLNEQYQKMQQNSQNKRVQYQNQPIKRQG